MTLGHLEKGESNMDAAIRETKEEAGIKVSDLSVDHNFEKVLKVLKTMYEFHVNINNLLLILNELDVYFKPYKRKYN